MKQIYQLTGSEYKELVEAAELNETQIEEKAQALYEKNGNHSITLRVEIGEDYDQKLLIKASGYVNDWESKYPISSKEAKKIMAFVKSRAEELFYRQFDSFIFHHDELKKEIKNYKNRKKTFTQITILGWVLAIISTLTIIIK